MKFKLMKFFKYQATGNDFIIIDNYGKEIKLTSDQVKKICDRRFGVGADGLILLEEKEGYDYSMIYYNSDGNKSTFCGNGSRCLAHFAHKKKLFKHKAHFFANNSNYLAFIQKGLISIKMPNISNFKINDDGTIFIDSGSPHVVLFRKNVNKIDVINLGREIRYSEMYSQNGVNINFVEEINKSLNVRTYERGVENETLSCGTGAVAAVIASHINGLIESGNVNVKTKGGDIKVSYNYDLNLYKDIYLSSDVSLVFYGEL